MVVCLWVCELVFVGSDEVVNVCEVVFVILNVELVCVYSGLFDVLVVFVFEYLCLCIGIGFVVFGVVYCEVFVCCVVWCMCFEVLFVCYDVLLVVLILCVVLYFIDVIVDINGVVFVFVKVFGLFM